MTYDERLLDVAGEAFDSIIWLDKSLNLRARKNGKNVVIEPERLCTSVYEREQVGTIKTTCICWDCENEHPRTVPHYSDRQLSQEEQEAEFQKKVQYLRNLAARL